MPDGLSFLEKDYSIKQSRLLGGRKGFRIIIQGRKTWNRGRNRIGAR